MRKTHGIEENLLSRLEAFLKSLHGADLEKDTFHLVKKELDGLLRIAEHLRNLAQAVPIARIKQIPVEWYRMNLKEEHDLEGRLAKLIVHIVNHPNNKELGTITEIAEQLEEKLKEEEAFEDKFLAEH